MPPFLLCSALLCSALLCFALRCFAAAAVVVAAAAATDGRPTVAPLLLAPPHPLSLANPLSYRWCRKRKGGTDADAADTAKERAQHRMVRSCCCIHSRSVPLDRMCCILMPLHGSAAFTTPMFSCSTSFQLCRTCQLLLSWQA
ncbi:hypothetical protein ABPG75_013980 [Micractinium tetrahymenae]